MKLIKDKNNFIFFTFILLSNLLLRFYFWPDSQPNLWGYFEALENHAVEYLLQTGMKPPLMFLLHLSLAKLFGTEFIFSNNILLINVIIFDFISFCLILYTLKSTKVPSIWCNIIILFYGFYLIPLEFWRIGTHYDSYSLFFNMLFISSIILFFRKQNFWNGFLLSISGCLLILYSSVYILVVPLSIIFCVLCIMLNKFNFINFLRVCCLVLILPITTGTCLCYKNYLYRDAFAPSTFGGVALMLTTMRTVDRNIIEGNKIVENSDAPEWYKWCWKRAGNYLPAGYEKDYVAQVNIRVFGHCLKYIPFKDELNSINDARNSHLNNKDFWPFDMNELKDYLENNNFLEPLNAVNKDIDMMINKKYLIWGMTPELSLYWTDLYGKVGGKIFWQDFSNNPLRYFKTFTTLFHDQTVGGSQFPLVLSKFNHRSGIYSDKFSNKFFFKTLKALCLIFLLVILIHLLYFSYLFIKFSVHLISKKLTVFNSNDLKFLVLGFPALLTIILYSMIVGEENSRYLNYSTPYLIVSFAYFLPEKIKEIFPIKISKLFLKK